MRTEREYGFTPKCDWEAAKADIKTLTAWMANAISDKEACKQITEHNELKEEINVYQLISLAEACCYL